MRGLKEWLKGVGRFAWKNADAVLVIVVAAGVVIAEVVGHPSTHVVDSAILVLLGATAFVLLRDREGRGELDGLRQLASDAISDRPYGVVWQKNEWDIKDREHSTMRMTQQLRFTRNDVSTIAHWNQGDGTIERYAAKWRRPDGSRWIPAKKIHEFPIHNGEKVIYSLDEEHSRGDMLDWCVERDALHRFPGVHETASLEARANSDHPRVMHIIWPSAAPPSHVEIRFKGLPARTLSTKSKDGRPYVEEKIARLAIGEVVEIAWTW